ncbi:MAG: alpha/beta hydrolase [Chromatiales bacterium]|nr:MAG: alpha/beta hydrolase [Chromatiales bacterium]
MKKIALLLLLVLGCLAGLIAAFPEDTTRLMFAAERSRAGLELRSAVVDGETWHYLEGGSPDAPVLLLLHGFGGDKDHWTRFSQTLVQDYRVIAPDLPGFGDSARHADWDYSLAPQRDRLARFVATLELSPLHIGGNSMGGHLAALYTHANPEQVLSLVLLNNGGIDAPGRSDMVLAVGRGENPLVMSSLDDFDRLLAFASYKKPFIPWPAKGVLAKKIYENAAFNRYIFTALKDDRYVPLEPLLGDIDQPVLIIWGEFDRVLDVSSIDVMQPLLPQAEVIVMPDTGHLPMLERPAETAALYLEFLAGL